MRRRRLKQKKRTNFFCNCCCRHNYFPFKFVFIRLEAATKTLTLLTLVDKMANSLKTRLKKRTKFVKLKLNEQLIRLACVDDVENVLEIIANYRPGKSLLCENNNFKLFAFAQN